MRQQGTVIDWREDRGFGFIAPAQPGPQVFFHVGDFRAAAGVRPSVRMQVSFELIHVGGKGPRAMAVRPAAEASAPARAQSPRRPAPARRAQAPASGAAFALPLMLAYGALMVFAVWRGYLPSWVLGASFALNLVTFGAYWWDKAQAAQGGWRVPEDTLHFWGLAGGWPGAWFAQQMLRHKSVKPSFRAAYWGTVVAHCAGFVAVLWQLGALPA